MSSRKSKNRSTRSSPFKLFKKIFLTVSGLTLLAGFVALGLVYKAVSELQQPVNLIAPELFEVKRGDSFRKVARRLEESGIIRSAFWFYWVARYKQLDTKLKAGEYWLSPDYSEMGLYPVLTSGKTARYSITFIEGWNLREVMAEFNKHPKLIRQIEPEDSDAIVSLLGVEHTSAEGLIFPDTYSYQKGSTDKEILLQAHRKMKQVAEELWVKKSDDAVVKTPYEALILASIIEKETGAGEERGLIAGVFSSRLKKGMRLQTDPTVIYGLGDQFNGNLTRAHLKQPTPYNTYVIKGLPPTPIAMPGYASIKAALNPEISGHLYFVARGDGTHVFSKNLKDHNKAVRQYQLKRRKDYRSTQ